MDSLSKGLRSIMGSSWPIIISLSCVCIIIHIYWLKKANKRISFFKEVVIGCFIIYLFSLFHIIASKDVYSTGNVNITFFKEITRYEVGSELFYRNIVGNICLFLPLGFFIGHLFKIKKYLIPIIIVFISLSIESLQLLIGRSFDVDDVILNFIGGILGYLIYIILNKLLSKVKGEIKDILLATILLIAILIVFLMML